MASLTEQILDALVARFTLPGWTVVKRDPVTVSNFSKLAVLIPAAEEMDGNDENSRYRNELAITVVLQVNEEDGASAHTHLREALAELQKVIHDPPEELGLNAVQMVDQQGWAISPPGSENRSELAWRLEVVYFQDRDNPDQYTGLV